MKLRKTLVSLCMVVVILTLGVFAFRYRQYAQAAAWHCSHSANLNFGAHGINIPRLWWVAKTDNAGRVSIRRASKSSASIEPEIEIAPVIPGDLPEDDSGLSRLEEAIVSERKRDSTAGWTYSSVSLKAQASVWHCIEDQQTILGSDFSTGLICNAPRIPYSLTYDGPPELEGEAELIFASFQ